MCGRFTIAMAAGFYDRFYLMERGLELRSRFNVAPSQDIPLIIPLSAGNDHLLTTMHWGLIPSWSKGQNDSPPPINPRAENLRERPMFRTLLENRRCLIPASGFFEWKMMKKEKIPYFFHRKDGEPFGFLGLFDTWKGTNVPFHSCIIITTVSNAVVAPIHSRMPVILKTEDEDNWLGTGFLTTQSLQQMLSPCPEELLEVHHVSQLVNDPRNDSPEIIEPVRGVSF